MGISSCQSYDAVTQTNDIHWGATLGGGAITQLAIVVIPPALGAPTADECAGVIPTCCHDTDTTAQAHYIHRCGALGGGAIAQLASGVIPPALHSSTSGECAGVRSAGSQGADAAAQANDIHRCTALGSSTIAQLSRGVPPPALGAPAAGECAGVVQACCQGNDAAAQAHDIDRGAALGGGAITQLAVGVTPPALDAPTAGECAGVIHPRCQGHDAAVETNDIDRSAALSGGTITQLAKQVIPPALDSAIAGECASMHSTCRQVHDTGAQSNDIDR